MRHYPNILMSGFAIFVCTLIIYGGLEQRKETSEKYVVRVSALDGAHVSVSKKISGLTKFTFVRFPPCDSCGGTTESVLKRLSAMGFVIVGLDEQSKSVKDRLNKIPNAVKIEWHLLPRTWRALLPGIYECSSSTWTCTQEEG